MKDELNKIHCPGVYCETAVIRDVLQYYGLNLSGSECMGLAGIFGFAYVKPYSHIFNLPHRSVSGIPYNAILPLLDNLGITYDRFDNLDFESSVKAIKGYLNDNIPVIIRVAYNQYYSEVFPQTSSLGNEGAESIFTVFSKYIPYNTGTHYILVTAYDEAEDSFTFIENLFRKSNRMPAKVLKNAMDSKQEMSAKNEWSVIKSFSEININEEHYYRAINRVVTGMTDQIDYFGEAQNGLGGLKCFIDYFFHWKEQMDPVTLKETLALLFLSGGGTYRSEGFYRSSFSKFLVSAEKRTSIVEFGDIAVLYKEIASKWCKFLGIIITSLQADTDQLFSREVRTLMEEIYDSESNGITRLNQVVRKFR